MADNVFLSIVIPAYDEEVNISGTLEEMAEYLRAAGFSHEVIIVSDGSKDATVEKASAFKSRFGNFRIMESSPNRGKGFALRKGITASNGEYVLFMDADNSTSIKELEKFLPLVKDGFDVHIASRKVRGSRAAVCAKRRFMGDVYIFLAKLVLGIDTRDINCGFKLFKRNAAKALFLKQVMNDWSFDAEVLYLCKKFGYKVRELPVNWVHKDTSKVRLIRDAVRSFVSLVRIRINDLRGIYKK